MSVVVSHLGGAVHVTIKVVREGSEGERSIKLDMSLQRHAYEWLDGAQSKPQNSILYHSVDLNQIQQDVREVGNQIEIRMKAGEDNLHGDFLVASGRRYRVDNVAMDPSRPPNHCYPISGPGLWEGVAQATFAAAAALRKLEVEWKRVPRTDSLEKKYKSLQALNPAAQQSNDLIKSINGARTHIGQLSKRPEMNQLGQVSGCPELLKAIVKLV